MTNIRVTNRLRLEPVGRHNASDLGLVEDDPEVARWYEGTRPSRSAIERRAGFMEDSWRFHGVHKWIACDRVSGEVVGRGGLSRPPVDNDWGQIHALLPGESWVCEAHEATEPDVVHAGWVEIGWAIRHDFRGRGYATEIGRAGLDFAFDTLGVQAVVACALRQNARSRAVAERLRMREAGDIRARGIPEGAGRPRDDTPFTVYVMLRKERSTDSTPR